MAWKPTGTNVLPVAKRRIFGSGAEDSVGPYDAAPSPLAHPAPSSYHNPSSSSSSSFPQQYGQSRRYDQHDHRSSHSSAQQVPIDKGTLPDGRERRKKSRWGPVDVRFMAPGIPTALTTDIPSASLELYALAMRMDDINRRFQDQCYVPHLDADRSPSPEPVYGADGKRANVREARYRKRLEEERHQLVRRAQTLDPSYLPPVEYKKPSRCADRVFIPDREFPEVNFIGLLIGPRGHTLKKMEADSGAKIAIRGRGSVKEGKAPSMQDGVEEELHCQITADSPEKVERAVKLIGKIVETACSTPDAMNDLKRNQLRELATLNGTLRDDEGQTCMNCGETGHRRWECPHAANVTLNITCPICGGVGHTARDCRSRPPGTDGPLDPQGMPGHPAAAAAAASSMDAEYDALMKDLGMGGGAPGQAGAPAPGPGAGSGPAAAPWHQGPAPPSARPTAAAPAPWASRGNYQQQPQPPSQGYGRGANAYGPPGQGMGMGMGMGRGGGGGAPPYNAYGADPYGRPSHGGGYADSAAPPGMADATAPPAWAGGAAGRQPAYPQGRFNTNPNAYGPPGPGPAAANSTQSPPSNLPPWATQANSQGNSQAGGGNPAPWNQGSSGNHY